MIEEKVVDITKKLALKYFGVNPEVIIDPYPTILDKPVKALCRRDLKQIIFSDFLLNIQDKSDERELFSTIVHEICHLKWGHGDPDFKKNVLSILQKERCIFHSSQSEV